MRAVIILTFLLKVSLEVKSSFFHPKTNHMKTLIVPTDFSPVSINAMNYATELALNIDASLLLLHVYQVPMMISEVPVAAVSIDEMQTSSELQLADMKSSIEHISSGKLKVYTEARLGDTMDEIQTVCESIQPFAVVMGTHGASGFERVLLGSTTLTAIRHLKWPVIAVPPGTVFKKVKKMGLACDFKDVVSSTPITFIKQFANEFRAELHVLNVDQNNHYFIPDSNLESGYLDSLLQDLHPRYHFLQKEDVVDAITEFSETNNLDLVIVIPKKHKLLEGIFHKSSSAGLVKHSHVPVIAIHE